MKCLTDWSKCYCVIELLIEKQHTRTCLHIPFSQTPSYFPPLGKCKTPFPWNMPSFISPSYLVCVGSVYSPLPSILKREIIFFLKIRLKNSQNNSLNTITTKAVRNDLRTMRNTNRRKYLSYKSFFKRIIM